MNKSSRSLLACALMLACSGASLAQTAPSSCVPLSRTSFGLETPRAGLVDVLRRAVEPHGWRLVSNAPQEWPGPMVELLPTLQGMDGASALRLLIDQAARAGWDVQMITDRTDCTALVQFDARRLAHDVLPALVQPVQPLASSSGAPQQVASVAGHSQISSSAKTGGGQEVAPQARTIPALAAGQALSVALAAFLEERGWHLRWQLEHDYFLEATLPIQGASIQAQLDGILLAYQQQGAMRGVVARLSAANRVVSIERLDHAR